MGGRGLEVVLGVAFLTLCPAASNARAAAQGQPGTRQIIDLGPYRLSAPPVGKWEVSRDDAGDVTFVNDKGRTVIYASSGMIELGDWGKTEEEAAEYLFRIYAGQAARDKEAPAKVTGQGDIILGGKRLYYLKLERSSAADVRRADIVVYLYFPSPFKKYHMFANFSLYRERPKKEENPALNPELSQLHAVVNSLELVDPFENARGAEADLIKAAASGNVQGVREMIGRGTNADAEISSFTALTAAAYFGRREVVAALLELGADINKTDSGGLTPLHKAIWGGEAEVAASLVERGANVNILSEYGFSALMLAAGLGDPGLVSLLVDKGAEINARNENGETALMFTSDGSAEVARFLIEKGADLNAQMDDGWTALMQSVFRGNAEIARFLLDAGANANIKSANGWAALMGAIASSSFKGNPGLVKLLIEKGADLDAQERESGQAPLHLAIFSRESDIARMLIGAGADVNMRLKGGMTPLILAVNAGEVEIVKLLLEKGADVNAMAQGNMTALRAATQKGSQEIVKLLLAAGAK